jgi:hypothetical protein
MNESYKAEALNPFELIDVNGVKAPRILTQPGREKDLEEYIRGWNDQKSNPVEQIVSKKEKTEIRNAENWYEAGAARKFSVVPDSMNAGTGVQEHEKDLLDVMHLMRQRPDLIPGDAWKKETDDESEDSNSPRFS